LKKELNDYYNKIYETVKDFDFNDEIIEIEEMKDDCELIDIEVSGNNLFYANDILTKNSLGVPATADFMAILGIDQDALVYESELHYKIVKNRMGGRVGEMNKLYYDARSLKLYDSSELDVWIEESKISGDTRNLSEQDRRWKQQ